LQRWAIARRQGCPGATAEAAGTGSRGDGRSTPAGYDDGGHHRTPGLAMVDAARRLPRHKRRCRRQPRRSCRWRIRSPKPLVRASTAGHVDDRGYRRFQRVRPTPTLAMVAPGRVALSDAVFPHLSACVLGKWPDFCQQILAGPLPTTDIDGADAPDVHLLSGIVQRLGNFA